MGPKSKENDLKPIIQNSFGQSKEEEKEENKFENSLN